MLELKLFCYESISGSHHRLSGTVKVLSGGPLVTYETELRDHHGASGARGQLQHHPRRSEPPMAIVARCLNAALQNRLDYWFDYQHVSLDVTLSGQTIAHLACVEELLLTRSREQLPSLFDGTPAPNPWGVACLACTASAWQQLSIPPVPEPLHVPVYEYEGTRYCRATDLPRHVQDVFDQWAFGASSPSIPGVLDAVFEWDVQHFLGAV